MVAQRKTHGFELIEGGKGRMVGQNDHGSAHDQTASVGILDVGRPMKIFGEFRPAMGWLSGSWVGGDRVASEPVSSDDFDPTPLKASLEQMEQKLVSSIEAAVGVFNTHATAPKSEVPPQVETAHNATMTDVTRAELDAKFELLDTKLGARIQQAVDAMQARDEVHKHALEKMQAEVASRDAVFAEIAKRQDLSTEKLKSEMAGRDAVYAEIAKNRELASEKFRIEMAGRDALAAERARAHELSVEKLMAEGAGREAVMLQRFENMEGELAKVGDSFKSVKNNIWAGVIATVTLVGATLAIAIGSFDSGREISKAIAESTVKLEQLIKAQEAKAAAPAAPATSSAATPAPVATPPEAPAAK